MLRYHRAVLKLTQGISIILVPIRAAKFQVSVVSLGCIQPNYYSNPTGGIVNKLKNDFGSDLRHRSTRVAEHTYVASTFPYEINQRRAERLSTSVLPSSY